MNSHEPLDAWINRVFDHTVADPPWYYSDPDPASDREDEDRESSANVLTNIAETFENSGRLLMRFSDEQLDQGFWYLFYRSLSDYGDALVDGSILLDVRARALRSFVPLFEQIMAVRCSPHLSHQIGEQKAANALNSSCYMWFDELPDRFHPQRLTQA